MFNSFYKYICCDANHYRNNEVFSQKWTFNSDCRSFVSLLSCLGLDFQRKKTIHILLNYQKLKIHQQENGQMLFYLLLLQHPLLECLALKPTPFLHPQWKISLVGDYLFVSKVAYLTKSPKYTYCISFGSPHNSSFKHQVIR